ncbi:hypothetical protein E2562_014223 [Oryza meyeriana var. granulata]|uniref:Uncharacterized protein n=1 Tax=Oryza meyeriana var. granulata TaxID=110450 RepID=A0A6G1BKI0_9ORYZ|nr:hypothetical protein E2562_014223 [Oryza meyeriana var. granulata]
MPADAEEGGGGEAKKAATEVELGVCLMVLAGEDEERGREDMNMKATKPKATEIEAWLMELAENEEGGGEATNETRKMEEEEEFVTLINELLLEPKRTTSHHEPLGGPAVWIIGSRRTLPVLLLHRSEVAVALGFSPIV